MTTDPQAPLRLLTPGPTAVPAAVLEEIGRPVIHHRTQQFRDVFAEVSQRLGRVFRTLSPVLTISGSGTTAYEAAQVSLFEPGRKALTAAGGKFGERWQDVYRAYGVEQVQINVPWGQAVSADAIGEALDEHGDVSVVTVVHSETSTATACDIKAIAAVVQKHDALLIVDGITAVGALPLEMDAWGIDVVVTGSQKALMLPPGLGFVGLGERAMARLERIEPRGCYNLDLRRWLKSWQANDVPFTPPINLIRGLRAALEMIETEGLENVWSRSAGMAKATRAAMKAMGLELVSQCPSDSVTGTFYPPGVDDSTFRAALRDRFRMQLAGGQSGRGGDWKNKIFRVSHMGYINMQDMLDAIDAVETLLIEAGINIESGRGKKAAQAAQ